MKLRLISHLAFLLLVVFPTAASSTDVPPHPNVVFVFTDDLGYADVGFNAELFGVETDVVTPNIDALAKEGMIFKQAYVAHPFCGPSRMALLTGRMPHTFGGQKNLPNEALNDGLNWSKTLHDPQWHDTQAGKESWEKNGMPKYEKTFSRRR